MKRIWFAAVFMVILVVAMPARAHEVRPCYLELAETRSDTFDVLWKVPGRGDLRLGVYAKLPGKCELRTPVVTRQAGGAFMDQWSVACPGGLTGETIRIDGLSTVLTDVLVRLERLDGTSQVVRLSPDAPSFVVEAAPTWLQIAGTYLRLGVEHILGGIDHLLFVLALLMMVQGWRKMFFTVTAFTVAHSITLALATLGFLHVPGAPVEAIIALSILFLASEIAHSRMGRPGLTERFPWVVAFTFGLLHGLGFASALAEVGLPETAIPLALFLFNVGVEIGQVLFVAAVLGLVWASWRLAVPWPAWAWRVQTYAIGVTAAFWVIQRVVGFWG